MTRITLAPHRGLRFARTLSICILCLCSLQAAAAVLPGTLVISEFMANPAAVSDATGEWLELFNTTVNPIDVNGLTLADNGNDLHVIDNGGPLFVASGDYLLLARGGESASNGGLNPDYVYSGFVLGNSNDTIVLSDGATEIARIDYDSSLVAAGQSAELLALPGVFGNYALTPASLTYGGGDVGTPGAAGSVSLPVAAVPVPAALWLLFSGVGGLAVCARRTSGCVSGLFDPISERQGG